MFEDHIFEDGNREELMGRILKAGNFLNFIKIAVINYDIFLSKVRLK